ncbi:MAG: biotin--[acetyl-CoA-carboxylase] ligase [Pelagibacteraceae bacterium TMED287]|nr:MAG: biotin--[acetyl-CoA-carboxylase] ligase [Pelagibacteraceae bacterium TMED287]
MKLKIFKLNSVKSTNDEAIKVIKKNNCTAGIICSKKQTKGRGTMGKKWISKEGNIFISIFFQMKNNKISFADFSLLNPYIIKSVLKKFSKYKIKIKLPNDLLIKNKKLSGILQEVIEFKKIKYLIIGIGINTVVAPQHKNFDSISLNKCSDKDVKNENIINEIKLAYEKILFGLTKHKILYLKKSFN